jgi:hypothetical protein
MHPFEYTEQKAKVWLMSHGHLKLQGQSESKKNITSYYCYKIHCLIATCHIGESNGSCSLVANRMGTKNKPTLH